MISAARRAETSIGTRASWSPCTISVGTANEPMSSRMSVSVCAHGVDRGVGRRRQEEAERPRGVARDLAAARRVGYERHVAEVQVVEDGAEVVGERVEVV